MNDLVKGRAGRIVQGWSANLVQTLLGIVQQIALVPVFLHFWPPDVFAAWLTLYSIGYMVLIADMGLQMQAVNRFLALRASTQCDARTAKFYSSMMWLYFGVVISTITIILVGEQILWPSAALGFSANHFDAAFLIITIGMVATLPSNLASALYRARGLYGRAVKIQCWGTFGSQIGQIAALLLTGSLVVVTIAYVTAQLLMVAYIFLHDVPRLFPFLSQSGGKPSWQWTLGRFRRAFPFAIVNAAESAIVYAPMLFVSAFVFDRVAVAQWGLTRVVAGLIRALSFQVSLPLAAELGHDYAVGKIEELRSLYARGSAMVTVLAGIAGSGIIAFWPDFFALWTHGTIPDDPVLTALLLIGSSVVAPSILALSYANYTDRGKLLASTKGLQLVVFLILSFLLIPRWGAIGAALAIGLSDVLVQLGFLTIPIIMQTLRRPLSHLAFLAGAMTCTIALGWSLGLAIRAILPLHGLPMLVAECGLWSAGMALVATPVLKANIRSRLLAAVPR